MNATIQKCACAGSGGVETEFGYRICGCVGTKIADAINSGTVAYASYMVLTRVQGDGPVMRDCATCDGDGFMRLDDTGWARAKKLRCDDECCGGRVHARCVVCCEPVMYGSAVAIEDARKPVEHGIRRECAEWLCSGVGDCADEWNVRIGRRAA